MSMYDFIDLSPNKNGDKKFIASEALLIGGKAIEDSIDGYQTLTVSGRGPLGFSINADDVDGMDGKHFVDAFFPERVIKVVYRLNAASPTEMIEKQDKLAAILNAQQFDFTFRDQPDWHFIGTVSDTEDPEEGRLDAKGSFTITVSDPHKYSADKVLQGASVDFGSRSGQLTEVAFTPNADTGSLTLTNSLGYTLSLTNGAIKAGETLIIRPRDQTIALNGVSRLNWLTFTSDFENLPAAGVYTTDPAGTLKITYREVRT